MAEDVRAWFATRIPAGWFVGPPEVSADGEEILVVGQLPDVELTSATSGAARAAARSARSDRFRADTRADRLRIARETELPSRRSLAGAPRAYELLERGVAVTVVETDTKQVGGLARTVEHKGYRFDIGGHRFFSKNDEVERLWSEILGPEMLNRGRLSRIYYRGRFFAYPIKAANALWNLGPVEAVLCLASYARARLQPVTQPKPPV